MAILMDKHVALSRLDVIAPRVGWTRCLQLCHESVDLHVMLENLAPVYPLVRIAAPLL